MKIVETNLKFKSLSPIGEITHIVIHHAASAGDLSASQIHKMHLNNGWSGIGYHFVVRQNGTIERGRPELNSGAHVQNQNKGKLGVCFPGNYETGTIGTIQKNAGIELVKYLKKKYPKAKIVRHSDLMATACPGKKFPFNEFKDLSGSSVNESSPTPPSNKKELWEISIKGDEVKELQKAIRVKADGLFGEDTLNACPLLKIGKRGYVVKLMQERLIARGYSGVGAADGIFGDNTKKTIIKLQECFSLTRDGIVGKNTWKALYGLSKGKF